MRPEVPIARLFSKWKRLPHRFNHRRIQHSAQQPRPVNPKILRNDKKQKQRRVPSRFQLPSMKQTYSSKFVDEPFPIGPIGRYLPAHKCSKLASSTATSATASSVFIVILSASNGRRIQMIHVKFTRLYLRIVFTSRRNWFDHRHRRSSSSMNQQHQQQQVEINLHRRSI